MNLASSKDWAGWTRRGLAALLAITVCAAGGCRTPQAPATDRDANMERAAVTYHVAKSGDDRQPGSRRAPFLTIGQAARLAQPGDTVIVHEGTYREWVQPARGGTSDARRITYKAAKGEKVVLKGSERITTWQDLGAGMWKVELDDRFFAPHGWYPFRDSILGAHKIGDEWLGVGKWCHLGEVFLNEERLYEKQTLEACRAAPGSWFTSREGTTQTIYAHFGASNPNRELAEITVRQAVFGTDTQEGIDFITVDGLTLMQSAEEWLPTYAKPNSKGVLFTSGTNWIIQHCTVRLAKMRGIVTDHGRGHVVRNNDIRFCGSAGIDGADTDGVVILGNWISDIHLDQPYTGAEHGGIKYHTSRNMLVRGNIIVNVHALEDFGDKGMGIWVDWPKGNNRITGNVVVDCTGRGLMVENPFGPHLIDNNILIHCQWPSHFESGNVVVHNLFHTTPLSFRGGWWGRTYNRSNKVFHNLFFKDGTTLVANDGNEVDYNSYLDGAPKHAFGDAHSVTDATASGFSYAVDSVRQTVTLTFTVGAETSGLEGPRVTTKTLGPLTCGKVDMEKTTKDLITATLTHPDGTPLAVDRDLFQRRRRDPVHAGPFRRLGPGLHTFVLRPNGSYPERGQGGDLIKTRR